VRVLAGELVSRRQRHSLEQAGDGLVQAGPVLAQPVYAQRPLQVVPDVVHGIERGERILQHELHLARVRSPAGAGGRQLPAIQQDLA
jgi:hypothetical protein